MPSGRKGSRSSKGGNRDGANPSRKPTKREKQPVPVRLRKLPRLTDVDVLRFKEKLALLPAEMVFVKKMASATASRAAQKIGIWKELDTVSKTHLVSLVKQYLIDKREYSRFLYPRLMRFGTNSKKWPLEDFETLVYSLQTLEDNNKNIRSMLGNVTGPALIYEVEQIINESG